jgi:hypothetical protein
MACSPSAKPQVPAPSGGRGPSGAAGARWPAAQCGAQIEGSSTSGADRTSAQLRVVQPGWAGWPGQSEVVEVAGDADPRLCPCAPYPQCCANQTAPAPPPAAAGRPGSFVFVGEGFCQNSRGQWVSYAQSHDFVLENDKYDFEFASQGGVLKLNTGRAHLARQEACREACTVSTACWGYYLSSARCVVYFSVDPGLPGFSFVSRPHEGPIATSTGTTEEGTTTSECYLYASNVHAAADGGGGTVRSD